MVCHRDGRWSYDCNMRKDSRLPSFASLTASSATLLGMTTVDGTKFSKSKAAGMRQPLHYQGGLLRFARKDCRN